MITAKDMREIADKVIWEKENSILEQNINIVDYIERNIQDEALKGNKFLRLNLDISSTNYVFSNNIIIPQKEFDIMLEKLKQEGFSIKFYNYRGKYKKLLIEWE